MRLDLILSGLVLLAGCSAGQETPAKPAPKAAPAAVEASAASGTLSTGDAQLQMGAAAQDAVYPEGAPAYPGANVLGSMRLDASRAGDAGQVQVFFDTLDSPDAVATFYRERMLGAGYAISSDVINPQGGVLMAKSADGARAAMIQIAFAEGKAVVTITGDDPGG